MAVNANSLQGSGVIVFIAVLVVILVVSMIVARAGGDLPPSEPLAEYVAKESQKHLAEEDEH
ncbi:MAG: hypothetical protein AB1345_06130 [Chloroflexota bacterium]